MAQYKVTAPLVITKRPDRSDLYLYEGAVVPDFVADEEVKRLLDDGFIEDLSSSKKAEQEESARSEKAEPDAQARSEKAEPDAASAKKPAAPSN